MIVLNGQISIDPGLFLATAYHATVILLLIYLSPPRCVIRLAYQLREGKRVAEPT